MNGVPDIKKRVTLIDPAMSSQPPLKKQRISPARSDHEQDDDDDDDEDKPEVDVKLETFRKEAIWRQLQEYKRQLSRAQRTVEGLNAERSRCEARLSAVDLSWNTLVQEADLLLPSTSTASNGHSLASSPAVSDPTLTDDLLTEALAQRSSATKALLARLGALHPASSAPSDSKVVELEQKCRELLEQAQTSQQAHRLLRTSHEATLVELETTHACLLRAEKKLDRLQSVTVAEVEGRAVFGASAGAGASAVEGKSPAGPAVKEEKSGEGEGTTPNGAAEQVAREAREEVEELRGVVGRREGELNELRGERVALKTELDVLKGRLASVPDESVVESVPFKLMQSYVANLTTEYEAKKSELDRMVKEADGLREGMEGFRSTTVRDAADQVEEIQRKLVLKEADLSRIRAQREDLRAEASELKAKEVDKMKSVEEVQRLNRSGKERIEVLKSEVRRLKMRLSAKEGSKEEVEMFAREGGEEETVGDLKKRLKDAEELLLALKDQLTSYASSTDSDTSLTVARSEMSARAELATAKASLARLQALLEPGPEGDVELSRLAKRVEEAEARVQVVEAQLASSEGETNMLYGEIERLSAAWSELDEQCGSKVFHLVGVEEKVQKAQAEKAKADNRYFSTMRSKEALGAENAVLTKLAEKQQRAIESAGDLQHSLGIQLTAAEKEITLHQNSIRAHQDTISTIKRENTELSLRNEQHTRQIAEINALLGQRIAQAETELAARKKVEEQLSKQEKELKQAKAAKLAVMPSFSSSGSGGGTAEVRELKKYNEDLSKMLKCSTCVMRFKGVIINRCGHLFCKECIDARLVNRQRKCPSCGIGFGRDDVSTVYF